MNRVKILSILLITLAFPLVPALILPLAHAQGAVDIDSLTKDFYCTCGCNYVLSICETQMSCDIATSLKSELRGYISKGMGREQIVDTMTSKYGNTVLATPRTSGFNMALWWYPVVGGAIGILVITLVVRRRSNVDWRIDPDEVVLLNEEDLMHQIEIDEAASESSVEKKYENILKESISGKKSDNIVDEKTNSNQVDEIKEKAKNYDDILKERKKFKKTR